MNVTFLFLAVIAAIVAWWLAQQRLTAKPWLEAGPISDPGASLLPTAKIGLGVFLAVAGSLFALLIGAYSMRMNSGGVDGPRRCRNFCGSTPVC
jgi:Heme/copper-type cytochrome/quinol oxidase, subunit 3